MKALILAAGMGTRLAPLTDSCPKCMVKVNGKPIIVKQIENLLDCGITDITVMSGYKHEVLESLLNSLGKGIKTVYNKDYNSTNNMYSAFMAKDDFYGESFVMMNADVFFDASVLHEVLKAEPNSSQIIVDIGSYNLESMKVIYDSNEQRIVEISKTIPQESALGCSIDVYKFSAEGGKKFFDKCEDYIVKQGNLKLWSEVALNAALKEANFKPCKLNGRWFEIDNLNDLHQAEVLFGDE